MTKTTTLLTVALVGSLGYASFSSVQWNKEKQGRLAGEVKLEETLSAHAQEVKKNREQHVAELQAMRSQFEGRLAQNEDLWKGKLDEEKALQNARIKKAYQHFEKMVLNGEGTIRQMQAYESKLKEGKALNAQEIEDLSLIASGIGMLKNQYQKPLQEFQQLGAYFEEQAGQDLNVEVPEKKRFSGIRKLFSKKYREGMKEQEKSYQQGLGKQLAYEDAQVKLEQSYAKAQAKMADMNLEVDAYVDQLLAMQESKSSQYDGLEVFFEQSRKMIRIHNELLDLPSLPKAQSKPSTLKP